MQFLHVSDGVRSAAAVWLDSGGEGRGEVHPQGVAAEAILGDVVARTTVNGVVVCRAATNDDVVVSCPSIHGVIARPSADEVVAVQADDGVSTAAALKVVIATGAVDELPGGVSDGRAPGVGCTREVRGIEPALQRDGQVCPSYGVNSDAHQGLRWGCLYSPLPLAQAARAGTAAREGKVV